VLLLLACNASVPADSAGSCEPLGWDEWGYGFFAGWCNACHAQGLYEAPVGVQFATFDHALEHRERILARVAEGTMPPGGGVPPEDLERLERLLECGFDGDGAEDLPEAQPLWTAEQAIAAVEHAMQQSPPDPWVLRSTYLDLLAQGDATCPGEGDDLQPPQVPLTGCTSSTGLTYAGVSVYEETEVNEDVADFAMINGDFTITDIDGNKFQNGGNWMVHAERDPSSQHMSLDLRGAFSYPAAEGWLGGGGSALLHVSGSDSKLTLEGSLQSAGELLLMGAGTQSGQWLDLTECGLTGTVQVRNQRWYRFEPECSCGPVFFDDEELGEGCVSTDWLAAWNEALALR